MKYHAERTDKDYYPIGCLWWGGDDTEMWYIEKDHMFDDEIDESTIIYCGYDADEDEIFLSEKVPEDGDREALHPDRDTYLDFFKHFVKWLNSPWSYCYESYTVHRVTTSSGDLDKNCEWVCEYTVVGYDEITSTLYGYGHTKEEAIHHCDKLFAYLQCTYNKENISF